MGEGCDLRLVVVGAGEEEGRELDIPPLLGGFLLVLGGWRGGTVVLGGGQDVAVDVDVRRGRARVLDYGLKRLWWFQLVIGVGRMVTDVNDIALHVRDEGDVTAEDLPLGADDWL
jgi:hypothetical protein